MLHYQQHGSGNTIVLLHGNSQSSTIWDDFIKAGTLSGYHIITLDMPGHGKSPRSTNPEKDYTLKGMAQTLKDFLNSLPVPYIIVANSLAGNLVGEIADQLPGCAGLVLSAPSVLGEDFAVPDIVQPSPNFTTTFTPSPDDKDILSLTSSWCNNQDEILQDKFVKMFKETDPALRQYLGEAIAAGDWSDEIANLKQVRYPIAVINGADEKIVYPEYLNRSDLNKWRGGVIIIPGAGHAPHIDQPEAFTALIDDYASEIFRSTGS